MLTESALIEKIEAVLAKFPPVLASWVQGSRISGQFEDRVARGALIIEVTNLANLIYGQDSPNAKRIIDNVTSATKRHLEFTEGMLRGTISSIQQGLLTDLKAQVLLDVQEDFVEASRQALANGNKDVAAALLCVVLEDATKRLAQQHGHRDLLDKEYSVVVTNLLARDVISKSTKGSLLSFKDLRNAALHAQWAEVSAESARSLLFFLPAFLESHGV